MGKETRTRKRIAELEQQWDLFTEKLHCLKKAQILGTDPEKIFSLDQQIKEIETKRNDVEEKLKELEEERNDTNSTEKDSLAENYQKLRTFAENCRNNSEYEQAVSYYAEAATLMEADKKAVEENARDICKIGNHLMKKKKYNTAISSFDAVLGVIPRYPRAIRGKAKAYTATKNNEQAIQLYAQYFQILKEQDERDAIEIVFEDVCKNGYAFFKTHNYEQAIKTYQMILSYEPYHERALYGVGNSYLALNKREEALSTYETYLNKVVSDYGYRDVPKKILEIENSFYDAGDIEKASELCKRVLSLDSSNSNTLKDAKEHAFNAILKVGDKYFKRGLYQKAVEEYMWYFETIAPIEVINEIRENSEYKDAVSRACDCGDNFRGEQNLEKAITTYQRVVNLIPNHVRANESIGNIYFADGQYENAIAPYLRAARENESAFNKLRSIATIYEKREEYQAAIRVYDQIFLTYKEDYPYYHEDLYNVANLYYKWQHYEDAYEIYWKVIKNTFDDTKFPEMFSNMEMMHRELVKATITCQKS